MNNYQNIPDLSGKVAIVTGANSGTGYGITYHLAKHHCKVIMASRNVEKLQDAKKRLKDEIPHANLEIEVVDITHLESIRKFSQRITSSYGKIDFLANNAGGGGNKYALTADKLEQQLAVNYLGHFAITTQLLPVLKDGSRIVTFSSIGYKRFLKNDLDVDHLMCVNPSDFNQMQEYCKAKLCSILFAVKLQDEFERIGSSSMSLSCHPGWSRTNLFEQADTFSMKLLGRVMNGVSGMLGISQSLYDGALPAIEALIADDAKPKVVYSPKKRESTGAPIPIEIDRTHFKDEDIDKLWDKTQKMLNLKVEDFM
ncbi:SDR family NAD(P)-dependent oxidoreductase [bacterium SCSIO 12741]|nr:SDR family NAD(P)-dependent oxidoreductase [bacterium SCSIO 12741]